MSLSPGPWFDGHLDLACMALDGRDLMQPLDAASGPPQPAAITLPSLAQGRVTHFLATLYTGLGTEGPCGYSDSSDLETPHCAGQAQLEVYQTLAAAGRLRLIRSAGDLDEPAGLPAAVLLMEGADPIRTPDEADWWFEQGVRAVGLTWARGTRYAGGNAAPGPLSPLGRTLVERLDRLGVIHDLSHLADDAARQLLDLTTGPIVASHSNARAVCLGHSQRNLPDELIAAIAERGGVIGLNLFSLFLISDGDRRRATVDETVLHIEHIAQTAGRGDVVALGSDMDGGFGADRLPRGINSPADLHLLADALSSRGWNDEAIAGFRFDNWRQFLNRSLPQ